jgi:hypothetical protein
VLVVFNPSQSFLIQEIWFPLEGGNMFEGLARKCATTYIRLELFTNVNHVKFTIFQDYNGPNRAEPMG